MSNRAVLEGLWLRFTAQEAGEEPTKERRRRIFQTLAWFVLTLLLALFIPDIGRVISLIGGLAACFIFIFPGKSSLKIFLRLYILLGEASLEGTNVYYPMQVSVS